MKKKLLKIEKPIILMGFFLLFLISFNLYSHSGRVDKEGCHNDKKESTNHCHQSKTEEITSTKIRIIDGDTIELNKDKIRFAGIDTPELGQTCLKDFKKIDCGQLSKNFLSNLIDGKKITCEIEGEDFYGRLIGECFVEGKSISSILVRNGFAFAYQKYSDVYVADEEYAKINNLGLWNTIFEYPWTYRKNN